MKEKLEQKKAELTAGIQQLANYINSLNTELEKKRVEFTAMQGALQVINELLEENPKKMEENKDVE